MATGCRSLGLHAAIVRGDLDRVAGLGSHGGGPLELRRGGGGELGVRLERGVLDVELEKVVEAGASPKGLGDLVGEGEAVADLVRHVPFGVEGEAFAPKAELP